ncbi:chromate transporter [Clostridiaceae bacterium M8S5]|nr:chromate transporter [Clostridiaceae bacterium M8S5]
MEFLLIIMNFFKIGLFTIGGGLVVLSLIQDLAAKYGWLTTEQFTNMIAIAQSTPGAIGINTATFVGYSKIGILGGILATVAVVLPGTIIAVIISHFINAYSNNKYVVYGLSGIRIVVIGIILAAICNIGKLVLIDIKSAILTVIFFIAVYKYKKHPIVYITMGAIVGMIVYR